MRILFLEWSFCDTKKWRCELERHCHKVDYIEIPLLTNEEDIQKKTQLKNIIIKNNYEIVCSFNFFPLVSVAIKELQTNCKYVAWVYDSPHLTLYSDKVANSCNYIFVFDRILYEKFRNKGIKTVYYLPLAGNAELSFDEKKSYYSDVTFVGSLYEKGNFYDQIRYLPENLRGYLEGIMEAQKQIYGYYILPELLVSERLKEIEKYVSFDLGPNYDIEKKELFAASFLAKKVANLERKSFLITLSEYFKVHFYSGDTLERPNIINCGIVPYGLEMYRVFNQSKININSTLRCIESGINLRIMDILSAGGFCLTNYQSEIEDYFEIGKDLEVYGSEQELLEKTAYYLEHDDIREEIAYNGMKKIKENYNYQNRVKEMMDLVTKN